MNTDAPCHSDWSDCNSDDLSIINHIIMNISKYVSQWNQWQIFSGDPAEDDSLLTFIAFCYYEPVWENNEELQKMDEATALLFGRLWVREKGFKWIKEQCNQRRKFGIAHPLYGLLSLEPDDIREYTNGMIEEDCADNIYQRLLVFSENRFP